MFNQEAMVRPNWQAPQVDQVNEDSDQTFESTKFVLNNAVVDADEGNETHVPQEVLLSDHFVKHNKHPCLDEHCEE